MAMDLRKLLLIGGLLATSALVVSAARPQDDPRPQENKVLRELEKARRHQDETLLTEPEAKHQWEYKVLLVSDIRKGDVQRRLNELGRFGWEFSGSMRGLNEAEELAIFKRPKN